MTNACLIDDVKVVRVWDPRTGSKNMKLRGHTDNIRALLIDSTGRLVLLLHCLFYFLHVHYLSRSILY
jgi:hypothetical protein